MVESEVAGGSSSSEAATGSGNQTTRKPLLLRVPYQQHHAMLRPQRPRSYRIGELLPSLLPMLLLPIDQRDTDNDNLDKILARYSSRGQEKYPPKDSGRRFQVSSIPALSRCLSFIPSHFIPSFAPSPLLGSALPRVISHGSASFTPLYCLEAERSRGARCCRGGGGRC